MEPNIEPAPPNRGESSLASVPVQPEPVLPPENKSFNPLILILAFLLVFFLGAGGMYAWQNYSGLLFPKTTPLSKITPTPISVVPTATPSPSFQVPADWKTFTNVNGYSFSYPPNLQVGAGGYDSSDPENKQHIHIFASVPFYEKPHADISFVSNTGQSLKDEAQKNFDANVNHPGIPAQVVDTIHQDVFNDLPVYEFSLKNKGFTGVLEGYVGYQGIYKVVWVEHNNKFFMLAWTDTPEFSQILSTFRFLP